MRAEKRNAARVVDDVGHFEVTRELAHHDFQVGGDAVAFFAVAVAGGIVAERYQRGYRAHVALDDLPQLDAGFLRIRGGEERYDERFDAVDLVARALDRGDDHVEVVQAAPQYAELAADVRAVGKNVLVLGRERPSVADLVLAMSFV